MDNNEYNTHDQPSQNNQEQAHNKQMGSLAGLGAGMLAGARIGSLIPVPVVGTFAGAMLGGVLGSAIGQRLGAATLSGVNAFLSTLSAPSTHEADQSHEKRQAKQIEIED